MAREFEVEREIVLSSPPERVFEAVTSGTAAWLFPTGVVAGLGAVTDDGSTVLAWDPPHRYLARVDGENGWFNAVECLIEGRDGGGAVLRWVHSGIITDNWDDQYDGISAHTEFYLHTLGQYLEHFDGRPVTYVGGEGSGGIMGPAASSAPGSLAKARSVLGLDGATVGQAVRLDIDGLLAGDAVVDYLSGPFIGLRTKNALVRVFGRDAWGGPVAASAHVFGDPIDTARAEKAVAGWLESVFA